MSPFMSSMPAAGFMEMPPVSKHTPLPTKHSVLARLDLAPCHCITTTREGRSLPCPTASSAPIFRASSWSSSSTSTSRPARERSRMRSANSTGPSMLAGSLTRSRARKTPSATALRAANALAAASGLAHWMTSLRRPSRRLLLGAVLGLAGAVLLEGVAAQQRAERQVGGEHLGARLAGVGGVGDDGRRLALARADLGKGEAAEQQAVELLGGLARADQDQPRGVDAGGRQDLDRRSWPCR